MIYNTRFKFWKDKGAMDLVKDSWNDYLALYDYDDETKDCICGYLQGVGTHDSSWMIARYKEILVKNSDCIRFININSVQELNELIEFISSNSIDFHGKISTLYLTEKYIENMRKEEAIELSEKCFLFYINILMELFNNEQISHHYYFSVEKVFRFIIPLLPFNKLFYLKVEQTHETLRKIQRQTIHEPKKSLIKTIIFFLEDRFDQLKTKKQKESKDLISNFFSGKLYEFLDKYNQEITKFQTEFPILHNIFIETLVEDKDLCSAPLYLFFCEPLFYRVIFTHLHALKNSENSIHLNYLKNLEKFLSTVSKNLEKNNFDLLIKKIRSFIESIKQNCISITSDASWGLHGEFKTLQAILNDFPTIDKDDFIKIEIVDDANKKNKGKVCDFRVFNKKNNSYQLYESKCKAPGFGLDGENSLLNDFLLTYIPLISNFIRIWLPEVDRLGLFPNFIFTNRLVYGSVSDYIEMMSSKGFQTKYKYENIRNESIEKGLVSNILSCFYDQDFILSSGCDWLPTEQELIDIQKEQAKKLFEKEFIQNTLKKSLLQLLDEIKRIEISPFIIEKFNIFWTLSIPETLVCNPFFEKIASSKSLEQNIHNQIYEILNQMLTQENFISLKTRNIELNLL